MVAGEWLCVYDIRINKPMVKESTHAGDALCIDWHPTRKYVIATGGGRDRSVKGLFVVTLARISILDHTGLIIAMLLFILQFGIWRAL